MGAASPRMRAMEDGALRAEWPAWLRPLLASGARGPGGLMDLAIAIAEANVARGGGPFGAVVGDAAGRVVEVGWNDVVPGRDSTAHAEIVAIRRAQRALECHDLGAAAGAPLVLYASCEPCIQCFGAVWWSGLRRVVASAAKAEAEALGFREGPVDAALWEVARREKGIDFVRGFGDVARAAAVLRRYAGRAVY